VIPRSVYVAIGIVMVLIGVYGYGHHKGWAERDTEMQIEIARLNDEARQKEQKLTADLNDNASKLQEATNAITQKQSALDRAIRAGRVRFPAPRCVSDGASATPAGRSGDEAGSESDRQTLAAIAAIVAEGQRNTEQLNACIDAYNQVKDSINGQR
jgi:prophage endopeptidase